jgi:DNA-binding SARP family transcriptional activator
LNIFLLGGVTLQGATANELRFPTKKSKSLFAYLVLYKERTFQRTAVAGLFWPERDEERAQRSLNSEVWRLRSMLSNAGLEPATFLHSDHCSIGFRADSDHWVDAAEFHSFTNALSTHPAKTTLQNLVTAVELYRGDLLEGLFDDWCLVQREAYRARLMAALEFMLIGTIEAQDWAKAIGHGRRLLELDPLQEHVHRALMRCYVSLGNRPAALRQYAACAKLLRDELQIEPMDETRQVYEAIVATDSRAGRPCPPPRHRRRARPTPKQAVLQQIDAALDSLSRTRAWLEDVRRQLGGDGDKEGTGG